MKMYEMKKVLLGVLSICCFAACEKESLPMSENGEQEQPSEEGSGLTGNLLEFDVSWEDVSNSDYLPTTEVVVMDKTDDEYDDFVENSSFGTVVQLHFSESVVTVTGAPIGVTLLQDGAHVTVTSSLSGIEYRLSGSASDGSIKMYSDKKFKLTLEGVSLKSSKGAAINIQSSKRVFVELAEGSVNSLIDAANYTLVEGEDQKACFFSEAQLLFSGSGRLDVTGNYRHAICSDDYIRFRSGNSINILSAVKDGIHTNDKLVISGGTFSIAASGDGIECEKGMVDIRSGEITIAAADDAIAASYEGDDASIVPSVKISNGLLQLTTTDQKGMGIKSTGNVVISGGIIKVSVVGLASKAIKADGNIEVTGGKLVLLTEGSAFYDTDDISSPAAINGDGDLTISGGELFLKSTGSAGKGISVDGDLTIENSVVKVITTGKQFVFNRLDSSAKGIKASGNLTIHSGTVWVKATGGEGSEGIESKRVLTINGGSIAVYAYDDCINASNSIVINGGDNYFYSSSNDAIDSNGTFTLTAGRVVAVGASSPEGGLDCDNSTLKITGGTLMAVGGASSTPTTSVTTQRCLLYNATATAGALLTIQSAQGAHVASYTLPRSYSRMVMLFSSDQLTSGGSYTIYSGGTVSGGSGFNELTTAGSYTPGSQLATFTTSSMVTTVGSSSSGGGRP